MRGPGWARLMAAGVAALGVSCAAGAPAVPVATPAGVRFVLVRPEARSVAVAGSFNGWSPSAHPMSRERSGTWSIVVPLPPGEHAFAFVIDGTDWISPPVAEDFVDDRFGSKNGVVIVRPADR